MSVKRVKVLSWLRKAAIYRATVMLLTDCTRSMVQQPLMLWREIRPSPYRWYFIVCRWRHRSCVKRDAVSNVRGMKWIRNTISSLSITRDSTSNRPTPNNSAPRLCLPRLKPHLTRFVDSWTNLSVETKQQVARIVCKYQQFLLTIFCGDISTTNPYYCIE